MNVRGFTRASESSEHVDQYFHDDLRKFAEGLDYLVSVLPNTASTRRIVDAPLLSRLPAHAVFVNVGRGAAVDEPALLDALQNGRLALAVLAEIQATFQGRTGSSLRDTRTAVSAL